MNGVEWQPGGRERIYCCGRVDCESIGMKIMVRWKWCVRACVVVFWLSVAGELLAEEVAAPRAAGAAAASQDAAVRGAIEKVLRVQQEAWNRGDVDAFMEHYWKSDDLTFSSGGKTTRGWQATLARYRERYPTREKMGRLTLGEFEITPLGDAAALVLGQWKLDGLSEPLGGNFTLVLRKIDGRWVIVHDHTSRLGE
jgi:L-asparaginase / beta-aspartyl-peptidase